jgi:sporulation protein YlmC with PRC-barrel domain
MTGAEPIDLGLGLLDHQVVDCDGRRCGKVDDLALDGLDGDEPRVAGVVVGAAALAARGRLGRLAGRLARAPAVTVAWDDVAAVDSAVRLRRPAQELGLGGGDVRAARRVARIPGSRL